MKLARRGLKCLKTPMEPRHENTPAISYIYATIIKIKIEPHLLHTIKPRHPLPFAVIRLVYLPINHNPSTIIGTTSNDVLKIHLIQKSPHAHSQKTTKKTWKFLLKKNNIKTLVYKVLRSAVEEAPCRKKRKYDPSLLSVAS